MSNKDGGKHSQRVMLSLPLWVMEYFESKQQEIGGKTNDIILDVLKDHVKKEQEKAKKEKLKEDRNKWNKSLQYH